MRTAIIQLARVGDIVSILPVAKSLSKNSTVDMYVMPEFAGILDAVSYVKPVLHKTHCRDVRGAYAAAQAAGYDKIICAQVDGNPTPPPNNTANFQTQQWLRAGYLTQFHKLKLVFDKRDRDAERASIERHLPGQKRPVIAFSFHGHSSPYRWGEMQRERLRKAFGQTHTLLDLAACQFPGKPHLLLGLLEAAECLLTIDTLPLHLAYATGTPTLALSAGQTPEGKPSAYYNSEPRSHWVHWATYAQSIQPEYWAEVERIIREKDYAPRRLIRKIPAFHNDKIVHVQDWYLGNAEDNKRIRKAQGCWEWLQSVDSNYEMLLYPTEKNPRTSKTELGDTRALPFIKDIIDYGAKKALPNDIVIFTNSDVCLVPEALAAIRTQLETMPACYSRRVDVDNALPPLTLENLKGRKAHVGADLFAFRAEWWNAHKHEIPDLLLSCEGWDAVARFWLRKHIKNPEMETPVIYHEIHRSFWARPEIIHENVAQKYNRELCEKWVKENGFSQSLYDRHRSQYLFKPDSAWA